MKYLRSFVIGSSFPVFVIWFLSYMKAENSTVTYATYTILNPLYFGLMNMLALWLRLAYKISLRQSYIIIGLLSAFIISSLTTFFNWYGFSKTEQYLKYYLGIIISHLLTFNIIIYFLETNI